MMPPVRRPLQKLNSDNARCRGPKPKSMEERLPILRIKPIQRVERSYTRERKIQVLMWIKYYRLPNDAPNTTVKMRPPTLDEASLFFQIPKSTIASWTKPETTEKILQQKGDNSRHNNPTIFTCIWPEMEVKLFSAFMERRDAGKPVRDGWFRRNGTELWKATYPSLQSNLFVFSREWFRGFLSHHRIVLRFVTNTAQSLPENYKEQILDWLKFNRRNRILTPFVPCPSQPSPHTLHFICNDNEGGIPDHRICNVDETPLPWEYLIGRTYHLKGVKTVWSKSAESGSEKRQYTLFLCIFADGVPRVPPILIFTAATGDKIRKSEAQYWDKRVHVEFTPTGWMNEILFMKFIKQFLVPIFGQQRSLFVFDRYRAHLTPPVIHTCRENNNIPSLIPAGTAPMTQPLDVAVNKPFKSLVKEFIEKARERKEKEDIDKWSVSQHRIVTTEAVGQAWEEWHKSTIKRKIVVQAFKDTGISLPVDGSRNHEIKIKGFALGELVIGDWTRSEEEVGYGTLEKENSELPTTTAGNIQVEYRLQDG